MSHNIKGLDGLRAICALVIMLGHIPAKTFAYWTIAHIPLPACCAYVFFVISGFLAGNKMTSLNSSRKYLVKKAKRLLPLYYSYILISVIVFIILKRSDEILCPRLLYYLFLLPSIPFCASNGIVPLVHLWFIGTLVLFYIVFAFFASLCRNKGENKTIAYAAVICIVWFCFKVLCRYLWGSDSLIYRLTGVTCFDVLFFGVIGGLIKNKHVSLFSNHANFVTIASWLLFLMSGIYGRFIPAPIRVEYISLLALFIILGQQEASFSRIVDNVFFRWLASISYEVYVTQIIVIILLSSIFVSLNLHLSDIPIYIISVICVLICSQIWKYVLRIAKL